MDNRQNNAIYYVTNCTQQSALLVYIWKGENGEL